MRALLCLVLCFLAMGPVKADEIRVVQWQLPENGAKPTEDLQNADIIAFQGAANPQTVRRMFAAKDFHMIFSRQLLRHFREDVASPRRMFGYTGILVRRASGLRVSRVKHLADVAKPADRTKPRVAVPSALAVKLVSGGKPIWVVSMEGVDGCGSSLPAAKDPVRDRSELCAILARQVAALRQFADALQRERQPIILATLLNYPIGGGGAVSRDPVWQILDQGVDVSMASTEWADPPLTNAALTLEQRPAELAQDIGLHAITKREAKSGDAASLGPTAVLDAMQSFLSSGKEDRLLTRKSAKPEAVDIGASEKPTVPPAIDAAAVVPVQPLKFSVGERFARIPGDGGTSPCALAAAAAGAYLMVDMEVIGDGGPEDFGFVDADPRVAGSSCALYADIKF